MSHKVSRKLATNEEKDKRQTESPVKEMKKKMAANAEKEKQAAEKEKNAEKAAEKLDKSAEKVDKNADKKSEKVDKNADKKSEKVDKNADKKSEKIDKSAEKKVEKSADKKSDPPLEKKEEGGKGEKSAKSEKQDQKKPEQPKSKQNGTSSKSVHNGVTDVTLSSNGGTEEVLNGTVSEESDDEMMLIIDDHDQDELFPELTYDDTSDTECFESPTPDSAPSRSFTRRSQVKVTRTPETPRPASDKQTDRETNTDDSKESKVLKLKDDALSTDRKLRSSDSPKPEVKKSQETVKKPQEKTLESPKKAEEPPKADDAKQEKEGVDVPPDEKESEKSDSGNKAEADVVIEIDVADEEPRKPDTNYSKSRVKVSPYRRSLRIADQTTSSVTANYTGNNTTMEMDITETSSFMSDDLASLDDSSYLRGLRSIRGRNSYKPLKEMNLRHVNRSARSANVSASEQQARPTGTVVGRKRKQDTDESAPEPLDDELAARPEGWGTGAGARAAVGASAVCAGGAKRVRLLERLAQPFRRAPPAAPPAAAPAHPARRAAEIVGINTDLPLSAPVSAPPSFDPESLKPPPEPPGSAPAAHGADADTKRCILM